MERIRLRSVYEPAPHMPEPNASGRQCADDIAKDEESGENKQCNQRQLAQTAIRFRRELDVCGQRRENGGSYSRGDRVALKSAERSCQLFHERPVILAAHSGENSERRQGNTYDQAAMIRHCRDQRIGACTDDHANTDSDKRNGGNKDHGAASDKQQVEQCRKYVEKAQSDFSHRAAPLDGGGDASFVLHGKLLRIT